MASGIWQRSVDGGASIPPSSPRSIPSPHDGEVGRDLKRARPFDPPVPSPSPAQASLSFRKALRLEWGVGGNRAIYCHLFPFSCHDYGDMMKTFVMRTTR